VEKVPMHSASSLLMMLQRKATVLKQPSAAKSFTVKTSRRTMADSPRILVPSQEMLKQP
jgi:hypothetical protein